MGFHRTRAVALVALAAAIIWGCESSDVLAPSGSQIIVEANPTTVIIDIDAGQSEAQSQISAQFFDMTGAFPLDGIDVTFSTTGGKLASADNSCGAGGTCRISGGTCTTNGDCPAVPAQKRQTDANGVVRDVLTLNLQDATPVTVSVRSSTVSAIVEINKTVVEGNVAPTALIEVTPSGGQLLGKPVTFDGRGSSDPDDSEITCFQWTIASSEASRNETVQNTTASTVTRTYNVAQNLSVTLRVSDREDAETFCIPGTPADESFFSRNSDFVFYPIACDFSDPVPRPRTVTGQTTFVGGSATVNLTGTQSSDPESGIVSYSWLCNNGTAPQTGSTATCAYSSSGTYNVELTVTNGCAMSASATLAITVNP